MLWVVQIVQYCGLKPWLHTIKQNALTEISHSPPLHSGEIQPLVQQSASCRRVRYSHCDSSSSCIQQQGCAIWTATGEKREGGEWNKRVTSEARNYKPVEKSKMEVIMRKRKAAGLLSENGGTNGVEPHTKVRKKTYFCCNIEHRNNSS